MIDKIFSAILVIIISTLVVFAAIGSYHLGTCNKDLPSETLRPAETKRLNILYGDSMDATKYRIEAEKWQIRYKASQRALMAATYKDKASTEKARHSATVYAKTPNLSTCDSAFRDSQRENQTKAYSIAIQDRMLVLADSLHRIDGAEIARVNSVKDSLSSGWAKANEALLKASKPRRFGLGIHAGYGIGNNGLSPTVSAGISYNILSW